jgi:hypothetical protein
MGWPGIDVEEHGRLVHVFTQGRAEALRSAEARAADLGEPKHADDVTSERVHLARLTGMAGDVHGNGYMDGNDDDYMDEEYPR